MLISQENSSQEWDVKKVKRALAKAEKKGWELIFLAADIDTSYATQTLGININKVAGVSKGDFLANTRTVSSYVSNYAATGMASLDSFQADIDNDVAESSSA